MVDADVRNVSPSFQQVKQSSFQLCPIAGIDNKTVKCYLAKSLVFPFPLRQMEVFLIMELHKDYEELSCCQEIIQILPLPGTYKVALEKSLFQPQFPQE